MQVGEVGRSDFHAPVGRADDLHELLRSGILDDVPHGSGLDPMKDAFIVGIGRQHEDLDIPSFLDQKTSGPDAVQLGHLDIHEHHIRPQGFDLLVGLLPVSGLADHFQVGFVLKDDAQTLPEQTLIVRDQQSNRHASPPQGCRTRTARLLLIGFQPRSCPDATR